MSSIYSHGSSRSSSTDASSNPSELSLATITSVTTNTTNHTASDLAGPGRNVGKLYSFAGRVLEMRFNKLARRGDKRGSGSSTATVTRTASLQSRTNDDAPLAGSDTAIDPLFISGTPGSSANAETLCDESNDSDDDDEVSIYHGGSRHGSPSIASTMDLSINFSSLTLSTNETASNIAGPGRLIAGLYSRGGKSLESRINVIATLAGRGPDAVCNRIKATTRRGLLTESSRLHEAAFRDFKGMFDLTVEKNGLDRDVKKLLNYTRSSIPATRQRALYHISSLAIEDAYLRGMFNTYGADRLLRDLKEREKKYRATDSDAFFPHLRKALVSISNNQVNDIVGKSERIEGGTSTDMFYELLPYLKDESQSFLVLRHFKRTIEMFGRPDGPEFSFHVYSDMAAHLADLMYSFPNIVEWDCMDYICQAAFNAYRSSFREGAIRFARTVVKWNSLLATTLLYPHLLPNTTSLLTLRTDVDHLLDPANADPHTSKSDFVAFPDHDALDPSAFASVALYPAIVLETHVDPTLLLEASHPSSSAEICRLDGLNELRARYIQPQLQPLWRNLSNTPNVIFSEILAERSWSWNKLLFMDRVPRGLVLRKLCRRLASFVLRESEGRECAERRIKLAIQLDRYCRAAMTDALVELFGGASSAPARAQLLPYNPKRINLDFVVTDRDFCRWVYRHRSTDGGRTHVRKYPPYSKSNPCEICQQKGIWDAWLESEATSSGSEVLSASPKQLMLLEVLPNQSFSAQGHLPVLVGTTDGGEREYLTSAIGAAEEDAEGRLGSVYTTVREGERSVRYYHHSGEVRTADHFWVFVLRYDTTGETEEKVREGGGLDVTGQCHWL